MTFKPDEDIIENFRKLEQSVEPNKCDVTRAMFLLSAIGGNIEAAFYEKQINEDEMNDYKTKADVLVAKFYKNCKCTQRK